MLGFCVCQLMNIILDTFATLLTDMAALCLELP